MCTVTYIPSNKGYFLTSNRDEKQARPPAELPAVYLVNNTRVLFPKDPQTFGTWIALKENGDAACLLNGAFENHPTKPPYRRSRGKIVLDIASTIQMADTFNTLDLYKIEPFTMVLVERGRLYECRWDGSQKFFLQLDEKQSHIWSSATLYDLQVRRRRKRWFDSWRVSVPEPSESDILAFHTTTGDGDLNNDLVMNRGNQVFTVSLSSIRVEEATISMYYSELINHDSTHVSFEANPASSC
ncbi:MAG: NRDE family protein [Chitinophagaceae bacterium]